MYDLIFCGADGTLVHFGPPPHFPDAPGWAYWHGWQGEILALVSGPYDFMVNLTLGIEPTRAVERLRPPVQLELGERGEERLLVGELQRGKSWQLMAVHLAERLIVPALSPRILVHLRLTYPLALRPDPARVAAWLAGAPALADASPRRLLRRDAPA
jgi:hypothetical protein